MYITDETTFVKKTVTFRFLQIFYGSQKLCPNRNITAF